MKQPSCLWYVFSGVIFETSQKEREDETLPQILIISPKLGVFSKCPLFWLEFRPGILEACDKASKWLPGREIPERSTKLEGKISIVKYTRWRIENYWLMFHKTYINPLLVNLQVSFATCKYPPYKEHPWFSIRSNYLQFSCCICFFFALSNGNTCLYSPECTLHQLHLPPPNLQPPSVNTRFICFSTKKRANQKFTQKEDLKNFRWRGKGFLLVAGGGCASSLATDLAPLWKPKEILKIHTTVGDPNHVFLNLIIMFCWTWSWDIMGPSGCNIILSPPCSISGAGYETFIFAF